LSEKKRKRERNCWKKIRRKKKKRRGGKLTGEGSRMGCSEEGTER